MKLSLSAKPKHHTIDPCDVIGKDVYSGSYSFFEGFPEIVMFDITTLDLTARKM